MYVGLERLKVVLCFGCVGCVNACKDGITYALQSYIYPLLFQYLLKLPC